MWGRGRQRCGVRSNSSQKQKSQNDVQGQLHYHKPNDHHHYRQYCQHRHHHMQPNLIQQEESQNDVQGKPRHILCHHLNITLF